MAMTFQLVKVTRPLVSLLKISKAANRKLDGDGSCVYHKESGIKTPIREKKESLVLRARIKGNRASCFSFDGHSATVCFRRLSHTRLINSSVCLGHNLVVPQLIEEVHYRPHG